MKNFWYFFEIFFFVFVFQFDDEIEEFFLDLEVDDVIVMDVVDSVLKKLCEILFFFIERGVFGDVFEVTVVTKFMVVDCLVKNIEEIIIQNYHIRGEEIILFIIYFD